MFRIESYITSIILSYVDRYIKNFRRQDAQVSIWEGDGSFQNLNLDLEVLEQELNLPLSFVSGHIHELRIHVPWTRLSSEPVKITINTIECVMKLKSPGSHSASVVETKPPRLKVEEMPPTYISSLVNKIIFNLSITCNNLILKYVEEDIVLSMNIKTLSLGTVNADWKPEFSELSPSQLVLRKLISLADVTICLDKRNASGRIESYLEPLLYRCFMTVRWSQTYPSVNALRAISTQIDIFCEKMAFTLSEPQVPMIMRLIALSLALNRKQFTSQAPILESNSNHDTESIASESNTTDESWSSWMMSWVPSIYPLVGEEDEYSGSEKTGSVHKNTLHFGFYVNTFSLALKLCEPEVAGSGKHQCDTFLHISLHGCRSVLTSLNAHWTNVQMGISQAMIQPAGDCCCGTSEASQSQLPYLSCGKVQESFLQGSLFSSSQDPWPTESTCTWDYHLAAVTETMLLEKTPAFAIDYLFCSVTPQIYDSEDEEIERLPPKDRVLVRYVAGPMVVRVCSGLMHRIQMLMKAAATYDYNPYMSALQHPVIDKNVLNLKEHLTEGGFDWDEELISCYFPSHVSQFTAFNTTVEFYPANHLPVHQSVLGRKLSRLQKRAQNSQPVTTSPPPYVILEWKCVYATITRPYNPDKWLQMANCFESGKIPEEIIVTAQTRYAFKVVGVSSSLCIPPHSQSVKVLEMSSLACDKTSHFLLQRLDKDINSDMRAQIESMTVTTSKSKLLLLSEIVSSLIATNNKLKHQACFNTIYNSSLIKDATKTTETIYLKIILNEMIMRHVLTAMSATTQVSIGAIQAFVMRLPDKGPEIETVILNAPDTENSCDVPFVGVVFQCPVGNSIYPPVLSFRFREMRLSVDPLLYDWLLYTPIPSPSPLTKPHVLKSWTSVDSFKMRKVSESSLSSHARRAPTPQESVHSSSQDRDTLPSAHPSSSHVLELTQPVPLPPFSERISGLFPVWKSLVISGDISQWNIYLPNYSLAQITPKSMESSLQAGLKNTAHKLQVVVVKLPMVTLRCASNKQNFMDFSHKMPVLLPEAIWTPDKNNFPWLLNVTDLYCYSLHGAKCLQLLKPVTVNCTITMSPKFSGEVLSSLALCVHLHTAPVVISISEEQVALLVGLAMVHAKVYSALATSWTVESTPSEETVSVKLISSDESLSTSQPGEESAEGVVQSGTKLTAWFQWLVARFTLNIYSNPVQHPTRSLKLTLDVEDIILSLDVERVYHKIKLKVATASICHYTRKSLKHSWTLGAFKGLVMKGYDPEGLNVSNTSKHAIDDASVSSGFLTATLTRARCSNLHSRIGTPSKNTSITKKSASSIEVQNSFITEIVVKLQPLDFVLSPSTLGTFFHVLDPLLPVSGAGNASPGPSSSIMFTTSSLPLLYLDLMAVRVMFPTSDRMKTNQHDVLIFQLDKMTVNPQPENPICRTPLRQDIYHVAEKHRILNIPGSEVEDRQYQVDLISIRVNTGMWFELEDLLSQEPTDTVVQNPALDWNEGRSPNAPTPKLLAPIVLPFNLCLVIAPAILYRNSVVVCGHSAEVNAVSEINVKLSLDQLKLCSLLLAETSSVMSIAPTKTCVTSIELEQVNQTPSENRGSSSLYLDCDSGFESVESSIHSIVKKVDPNMAAVHSVTCTGIPLHVALPSPLSPQPLLPPHKVNMVIPLELLVTGNGFSFGIFRKDDSDESILVEPLLYLHISQPHLFISKVGETTNWQASIFDLSIKSGKKDNFLNSDQLSAKSYPQSIVKTRNGDPHPVTGIPPALLTAKLSKTVNRSPKVNIEMGRPVRVSCSISILQYFSRFKELISDSLDVFDWDRPDKSEDSTDTRFVRDEVLSEISSEQSLHDYLTYFSQISLNTQQVVLVLLSKNQLTGGLTVSVNRITANLSSTFSLQQTVTGSATLDNFAVATRTMTGRCPQLLVNPWTFSLETSLSWESWIPSIYSPVVHLMVDSDVLAIDISPNQLQSLQELIAEYSDFYSKLKSDNDLDAVHLIKKSTAGSCCEEQHYNDDLQAGAFQFVESSTSREDLPQTYQVVFWSSQTAAPAAPTMAWRYPQPRALTKLRIHPIPFRINAPSNYIFVCDQDSNVETSVKCTLQYYDDIQASYKDYAQFSLSESEICVVDLPVNLPERVVATTWRVVLGSSDFDVPPIPVKALAASLRVDSYFAPSLVPTLHFSINLTSLQVSLWSQMNSIRPLPEPLSRYVPDGCFPLDHDFLTASIDQANVSFIMWPTKSRLLTITGRPRLDIVSYMTLNKQCCIPPFSIMATLFCTPQNMYKCSLVSGSIYLRLGPAVCHTLTSSLSVWLQYTSNKPRHQIVLTPYVICNNSCLSIKVGQAGTDEVIPLQCLQCHLYSWRTTKAKLLMRFSLLDTDHSEENWSQGLALNKEGSQLVKVKDKTNRDMVLVVTVKNISSFVSQVIVGGQLVLRNSLSSSLELRIIPDDTEQRQSSLIVQSNSTPPSIILDPKLTVSLRIRFNTISGSWSGLIPLKTEGSKTKQWLVKVPLKEKEQFRSVWCRVIWDSVLDVQRILVAISPMYTIRSLLPCEASVVIETPELKSSKSVVISGRGTAQDLDCPGLSESLHHLTFQLDGRAPASSPHVPLSYPIMEGNTPPPKPLNLEMDSLLDTLYNKHDGNTWPFLGPDWASVTWLHTTQPDTVTHVKVRFTEECATGNSLFVELQPWALLLNTLGCHVYLQANERIVCSVPHSAVISPPLLESTFQIGVDIGASFHLSTSLQLSRDRGFYMPKISGLIAPSGHINTCIDCVNSLCYANVSSSEVDGIRLIHIKSSYVITNVSSFDVKVTPLAVRRSVGDVNKHILSGTLMKSSSLLLKAQRPTSKLKCQPITEWYAVGSGDVDIVPYLVVSIGDINSCPIRITECADKQSIPVILPVSNTGEHQKSLLLTSQCKDGQTYLLLWDQPWPQITIFNDTKSTIVFSKAQNEQGKEAALDSEDWAWRLHVPSGNSAHYHLPPLGPPELGPPYLLPSVVIAIDKYYPAPSLQELKWSDAINLTTCSGRLLTLSGLPEVCMSVMKKGFTTHIRLMQASHTEVLAVNIRGQLSRDIAENKRLLDSERNPLLSTRQPEKIPPEDTASITRSDSFTSAELCDSITTGVGAVADPSINFTCFIKSFTSTLLAQSDSGCDCREVAALTLDNIGVTLQPHPHQNMDVKEINVHVTMTDIQLDNQEYHSGGYDFPVVLMKRMSSEAVVSTDFSINQNANILVNNSRKNYSVTDIRVIIDMNSHESPAIQDISLKLFPLQLYVEDTFAIHVMNCLNDIIPEYFLTEVTPSSSFSSSTWKQEKPVQDQNINKLGGISNSSLQTTPMEEDDKAVNSTSKVDVQEELDPEKEEDLFNVSEPDLDIQQVEETYSHSKINNDSLTENDLKQTVTEVGTGKLSRNDTLFESEMLWSVPYCRVEEPEPNEVSVGIGKIPVPSDVLASLQELARPLRLRSLSIGELNLLVSVHTSTKFYIALDHSPLYLSAFQRSSLVTTAYRLGHALTLHYFLGAIYGTGWAIGSLELLGAPGGLARTLGSGLRDFVSLPYRGILLGPRAFLVGIAHGSASLMKHITAGTVTSVTKLAASWARTLDRLTLDNEGLQHSEELRRLRPNGLTQGFVQGLTEFGISLLGAVGSIVHHPLQYMISDDPDRSLVNSIGLGLVGMITRPLSGAAELVALTGEGLLSGVGWSNNPKARHQPVTEHSQCGTDSELKYLWKLLLPTEQLLLITEATTESYEPVTLLITNNTVYVVNSELDIIVRAVKLMELKANLNVNDPTLVAFHVLPPHVEAEALSRSRVAEFVRESQRVLNGDATLSNLYTSAGETTHLSDPLLRFYISPQTRDHFLAVLSFVTRHANGQGFNIMS